MNINGCFFFDPANYIALFDVCIYYSKKQE